MKNAKQTILTNMILAPIDHGDPGPLLGQALGNWEAREGLSIRVEESRIAAIAPIDQLESSNAEIIDLGGDLLTPGLVDAHTHPAFIGTRAREFQQRLAGESYEAILEAGGGIHNSVAALRESSDEELLAETTKHLGWLKAHGVVACEGKSGYGLSLRDEKRSLQAIADAADALGMHVEGTCLAAHVLPKDFAGRKSEYLDLVCDTILPELAKAKLATAADVFVENNAFDADDLGRVMRAAKANGLGVHVHADQLSAGQGAILGAELGALSADHLEYSTPETMAAMAEAGTCAILLPGSTFVLGMDCWADGRAFVEAGVPLVLATDFNPGSSPIMNPAFVMSLACLKLGLDAKEALAAFTRNAAYCLRIHEDFGSIEVGKRAAFTRWGLSEVEEIPYWVGANLAEAMIF